MISNYQNYRIATDAMLYEQMRNQLRYDMQKEMGSMMHQMQYQMMPVANSFVSGTVEPSIKPVKDRKKLDNLIAHYYHSRK